MNAKFKEIGNFKNIKDVKIDDNKTSKSLVYGISGYGDILTIGQLNVLKIFQLKPDSNYEKSSYSLCFNSTVSNKNNPISRILVIPIISLKQSSHGMPDWTCICIGFSNGDTGFYDEWGQLIFTQSFINMPSHGLNQSGKPNSSTPDLNNTKVLDIVMWNVTPISSRIDPRPTLSNNAAVKAQSVTMNPNNTEYLYILYEKFCIEISGKHLYETLCSMKRRLAREQAGFIEPKPSTVTGSASQARMSQHNLNDVILSHRKLLLGKESSIGHIESGSSLSAALILGNTVQDTLIDNFFYYSTTKGPFIDPADSPNRYIPCAIVGQNPFVKFYKLPLESDSMDMGDIAHAVYTKVKGAIFKSVSSWFGGSSDASSSKSEPSTDQKSSPTHATTSTVKVQSMYGIDESRRFVTQLVTTLPPVCLSWSSTCHLPLAAIADNHGRVFLIDIKSMTVLRVWKGYRDVQLSISTVTERRSSSTSASGNIGSLESAISVNYLVIYSPRRSLIEIWPLPFGERVVSFDLKSPGRLIHVAHRGLGLAHAFSVNLPVRNINSTYYLETDTGKMHSIEVPFHLSMTATSSNRSQDNIVMKQFKKFLKSQLNKTENLIQELHSEFESALEILKMCVSLDYIMNVIASQPYIGAETFMEFIDKLLNRLSSEKVASASSDNEKNNLAKSWINKKRILHLYIDISRSYISSDDSSLQKKALQQVREVGEVEEKVDNPFNLQSDDIHRINKIADFYIKHNPHRSSSLKLSKSMPVVEIDGDHKLDSQKPAHVNSYVIDLVTVSFNEFLNWLCVESSEGEKKDVIRFVSSGNISDNDLKRMGQLFLKNCISNEKLSAEKLKEIISSYNINCSDCLRFCLTYILCQPSELGWNQQNKIKDVISVLLELSFTNGEQNHLLSLSSSSILQLSKSIFAILEKSSNLLTSLLICMLVRVKLLEMFNWVADNAELFDENPELQPDVLLETLKNCISIWNDHCQRYEDLTLFSSFVRSCPLNTDDKDDSEEYNEDNAVKESKISVCRKKKRRRIKYRQPVNNQSYNRKKRELGIGYGFKMTNTNEQLTMGIALDMGKGIFSDRICKWFVKWNFSLSHITELYKSLGKTTEESMTASVTNTASRTNSISVDDTDSTDDNTDSLSVASGYSKHPITCIHPETKEIFQLLYKQLPHSLEFESVLINLAWEYARIWSMSLQRIEYLSRSIDLLASIGPLGGLVVQGVSCLMWELLLTPALLTLFPLREGTPQPNISHHECFWAYSKGSKDSTSGIGQAASYSDNLKFEVLERMIELFGIIYRAYESMDVVPAFSIDRVWNLSGFYIDKNGVALDMPTLTSPMTSLETMKKNGQLPQQTQRRVNSLIEMVVGMANGDSGTNNGTVVQIESVQIHKELFIVLQLILMVYWDNGKSGDEYNRGKFRYQTLFSREIRRALFSPLTVHIPYEIIEANREDGKGCRLHFLERIIREFVFEYERKQSLPDLAGSHGNLSEMIVKVKKLDELWLLHASDTLRNCLIESLYRAGLDGQATQFLSKVQDTRFIVQKLLDIAGIRLKRSCKNIRSSIKFSKRLTDWLSDVDAEETSNSIKIPDNLISKTIHLVDLLIELLPDNHPSNPIAIELIETFRALASEKQYSQIN